jgi:hypothetical protein
VKAHRPLGIPQQLDRAWQAIKGHPTRRPFSATR